MQDHCCPPDQLPNGWDIVLPNQEPPRLRIEPVERTTVKARKIPIAAMLALVLVAACGDNDNPSGGSDSGTGNNTPTTERGGYN